MGESQYNWTDLNGVRMSEGEAIWLQVYATGPGGIEGGRGGEFDPAAELSDPVTLTREALSRLREVGSWWGPFAFSRSDQIESHYLCWWAPDYVWDEIQRRNPEGGPGSLPTPRDLRSDYADMPPFYESQLIAQELASLYPGTSITGYDGQPVAEGDLAPELRAPPVAFDVPDDPGDKGSGLGWAVLALVAVKAAK